MKKWLFYFAYDNGLYTLARMIDADLYRYEVGQFFFGKKIY